MAQSEGSEFKPQYLKKILNSMAGLGSGRIIVQFLITELRL
jgi:hypothetical protein